MGCQVLEVLPRNRAIVSTDELRRGELYAVQLDETSVVNLPVVCAMLGMTEGSAKKWFLQYGVKKSRGKAWLTTGRQVFLALERYFDEQERAAD